MWSFTGAGAAAATGGHTRSRSLLVGMTIGLTVVGAGACGSANRGSSSGSVESAAASARAAAIAAAPQERDGDGDIDTLSKVLDKDDDTPLGYGAPAGPADRQAIVTLLRRYYTTAAAGDGARACSMLDPLIAEQVVEEHHHGKGPSSLRGDTCAQVMSKLFEQRHHELAQDAAEFRVTVVELRHNRGLVLMPYSTTREMQVIVRRDNGVWKMDVAVDNGAQ